MELYRLDIELSYDESAYCAHHKAEKCKATGCHKCKYLVVLDSELDHRIVNVGTRRYILN